MLENLNTLRTDLMNLEKNYTHKSKVVVDSGFIPSCRFLNSHVKRYVVPEFEEREIIPYSYSHNDRMIILFSGGKLSLACALLYKNIGKDIVLFHICEAGQPVLKVKKIAEMLNAPLHILEQDFPITPFAGSRILQAGLEYAVSNACSPRLVYGYFDSASAEYNDSKDWLNCEEFISTYKEVAKRYVDGFTILNPIPNYAVMWDEILKHKAYIPYIEYSDENDRLLFENIRMDYRLDEADCSRYIRNLKHFISLYKKNKNKSQAALNDVWNEYFFYRIENSIFYKELMEKFVSTI